MIKEMYVWYKDQYSLMLKNMPGVPDKLYVRGKLHLEPERKFLCVIGSRRATSYGKDCVNKILQGLRGYPISIVSGLAQGMDSFAHEAALDAGLHCIAFPGSTLAWPSINSRVRNGNLPRRILEAGGALVSRWPPDYEMGNWAFPARNALMAGISDAVLIIEAGERSGALMTAEHALDYSRQVYVVPGPIHASLSYGPHFLAREGAPIITCGNDLLQELGFAISAKENRLALLDKLDPVARKVYEEISLGGDITPDTIMDRMDISIVTLNQKLTILELEGMIKVTAGGIKLV